MNFVTKNLISELKELLELRKLIDLFPKNLSDNKSRILEYLDNQIVQNIKDIVHTERL